MRTAVCCFQIALAWAWLFPAPAFPAKPAGFSLVGSGDQAVSLSFELGAWSVDPVALGGRDYCVISAESAGDLTRAGYPSLPEYKAVVAVPPGSTVRLDWTLGQVSILSVPLPLPDQPSPPGPDDGTFGSGTPAASFSEDFLSGGLYPSETVVIRGPKRLRDLEVVEVFLRPFAFDPSTGQLRVVHQAGVSLSLAVPPGLAQARPGMQADLRFEELYRTVLLNYESSRAWRIPRQRAGLAAALPFSQGGAWVSLRLGASDMYAVSPQDLRDVGVETGQINPATFRLFSGGGRMLDEDLAAPQPELREVAVWVTGAADGSFDPDDRIVFYGEGLDRFLVDSAGAIYSIRHRYDSRAVYWLTWGDPTAAALRMAVNDLPPWPGQAAQTTAETWRHWEENTQYLEVHDDFTSLSYNPAPDYWAWKLEQDLASRAERAFVLEKSPQAGGNFLRCEFYGTIPRTTAVFGVALNGSQVLSGSNVPLGSYTSAWVPLPGNLLQEGQNSFVLQGQGQVPGFFELRLRTALTVDAGGRLLFHQEAAPSNSNYELASSASQLALYEFTDPARPVRITVLEQPGAGKFRFGAPASQARVRSFAAVADGAYARALQVKAESLPGLRTLDGADYLLVAPGVLLAQAQQLASERAADYRVQTVTIEDIYNEFSFGPVDPAALRNFLRWTFERWSTRPAFVLFFGDGHNDFRGYTAEGRAKPNLILPYLDNSFDLVEVEEWFVRFEQDGLPGMALGRIPVQNQNDAAVVVDKIIKYDQGLNSGDWVNRAVLVADDGYVLGRRCDPVTNHVPGSESLDSIIPKAYEKRKIYLEEYPFEPPAIGTRKPAATQALIAWWNRGALLINYLGHGSPLIWSQERVFNVEQDLPMLTNGYRLPLVINASCSIGYFDDYRSEAMAERILTFKGGGAVAAYAGTRVTFAGKNLQLNKDFVSHLFAGQGMPIGTAALAARISAGYLDKFNAQRYTIFGDPALRLHRPELELRFSVSGPGNLRAGDKVDFSGQVADASGSVAGAFSGVARVKFLGPEQPAELNYECRSSDGTQAVQLAVSYVKSPAVLFDGPVTVSGGGFSGSLVLPANLSALLSGQAGQAGSGRFIGYATSEYQDASGAGDTVAFFTEPAASGDTTAPRLVLMFGGKEIADGDRVSASVPLQLLVYDESGVNTTGKPGVQLTMEVDQGATSAVDLTDQFQYHTDSFQEGTVTVSLQQVGEGLHLFSFRATDNRMNTARAEWMLQVSAVSETLSLRNVLNYPNPFREETDLCFETSAPVDVLVRIFTVAGRPVREIRRYNVPAGFNWIRWDGRDEYQEKVANGVYLYKISCKATGPSDSAQEVDAIGKALLSR